MNVESQFDLVISGGGLAGASLALDSALAGFSVALVDIRKIDPATESAANPRAIALTYSSGMIFRRLKLWDRLQSQAVSAIRQIEVTDTSLRGQVWLRACDAGVDALGWNVESQEIQAELYRSLVELDSISIFSPAQITESNINTDGVSTQIVMRDGSASSSLKARALIIADGGESTMAGKLGFKSRLKEYEQRALVCRVETDRPNRHNAYEHFTRSGPLALLPSGERGYSVVWTLEHKQVEYLRTIEPQQFLFELQDVFSDRVGRFVSLATERMSYPLRFSVMRDFVRPRVVVIGNAMHTFHPVAGQSFNLALRESAELVEVLSQHRKLGWDIGSYDVLADYQRRRQRESQAVAGFTDGLIRMFANDYPMRSLFRNIGLDFIQAIPPVKRFLLLRTMGLRQMSGRRQVSEPV